MQTVTMLRRSPNATLKEKLVEHYNNRNFTATPQSASRTGLTITACAIFSLFLECLVILIPGVYTGVDENGEMKGRYGRLGERYWMVIVVVMLTWVEVTWNWWRTYYDVPNWVTKDTKTAQFGQMLETPPGWKHCPTCQLDAPPRSHHCQHCGHCILKRDHHCFFTASCVGHYNQRHFVMFCLYTIWGCLMGFYLHISYISLSLPLPEYYHMYIVPVPIFKLLTGDLSFGLFLLLVHVYINIVFIGLAVTFLFWQFIIILRGQTSYEAWKMIRAYDSGLYTNITSVFGSPLFSWLLFFAPLMLPMEADGSKWKAISRNKGQ